MGFLKRIWSLLLVWLSHKVGMRRAEFLVGRFRKHLVGRSVLDLGCGMGHLSVCLAQYGFEPCLVDTEKPRRGYLGMRFVGKPHAEAIATKHNFPYILYNGRHLTFADGHFDVVLIAFVLHHTDNEEEVLEEALRVTDPDGLLVVLEDLPRSKSEAWWNRVFDSIVNLDLFGHPHHNRSREEWIGLFTKYGAKVVDEKTWTSHLLGMPFPNVMFVLRKQERPR